MNLNTKLIHGDNVTRNLNTPQTPVYLANAFNYQTAEELEKVFSGSAPGHIYTRISNPTVLEFERRIASIEGGRAAVATSSGISAIYITLKTLLKAGDEIVSSSSLFGGSYNLIKNLERDGIKVKFLKELSVEEFKNTVTKNTKVFFSETIGNPKLDVLDIEEFAKVCNDNSIVFVVDSTVTTPVLVKPLDLGADVVIHSTSKYINGFSNSIGGIIVTKGINKLKEEKFDEFHSFIKKFGPFAFTAKLRSQSFKDIGAPMSPMCAYLNLIGVETLALRIREHSNNALKILGFLKENPKVVAVNYPLDKDSKYYDLAQKYYPNGASGILTFRLGSKENAFKFINELKLVSNLANIGDSRTLIIHPASTICGENSEEEKLAMGVYEDLVRLSVGIEDAEDIINDFKIALEKI